MLVMSPNVKIKVTAMIKPMAEFRATDHIIAFGNVAEASLISSAVSWHHDKLVTRSSLEQRIRDSLHMCTEQSYPSRELKGDARPIMADKPVLDQPPLFVNVKRTSYTFPRGAKIHRGIIIAKRPVM